MPVAAIRRLSRRFAHLFEGFIRGAVGSRAVTYRTFPPKVSI